MIRQTARLLALALLAAALTALGQVAPAEAAPAHRILLAGDSITQGSSGDYTWRFRLWNKLARTAPGQVAFVGPRTGLYDPVNDTQNRGFYADRSFTARNHAALWGTTFEAQLPRIRAQVTDAGATTLVELLGLNDIAWLGKTPAQTLAGLETFVARAREGNPDLDIVLGQLVKPYDPWTGQVRLDAEVDAYNDALPELARRLGTSRSRIVVARTSSGWSPKRHTYDGTHPNPTGETLIAQRMSEGLAALGIGTRTPDAYAVTAWGVRGPAVSVTGAPRRAELSWDRTSTGANTMYIQQRVTAPAAGPWVSLPYPVSGNGFSAGSLAGRSTYQFRIAPGKGFMKGLVGTASSVYVPG